MRSFRRAALAPALLAAAAFVPFRPALADVADIAWSPVGTAERSLAVPGGRFAELCGKLGKGERIAWRFEADAPLAFNIHYHVGKEVVYPVRHDAMRAADGTLAVPVDQDYCWMWSNASAADARVQVTLKR